MKIGILGGGQVGQALWNTIYAEKENILNILGEPLEIKKVLVRDLNKKRDIPRDFLTNNPDEIIYDKEISLVVEVMGGEEPAHTYIKKALEEQKFIVTANKEVIALHGDELYKIARKKGVDIAFEASVGGGIPLIKTIKEAMAVDKVKEIWAIVNGTTNYILTKMEEEHRDFEEVLKEAQKLGYAEPDPSKDILGLDTRFKLAILSSFAHHTTIKPNDIYTEGIEKISLRDIQYAKELGYKIKLLAISKFYNGEIEVRVHPTMISLSSPLSSVNGVYNAILLKAEKRGDVLLYGEGAGPYPTAMALLSDILEASHTILYSVPRYYSFAYLYPSKIKKSDEIYTRYYMRLWVKDQPGVLAQIAKILGENNISISSVVQKETSEKEGKAELVILTHKTYEKNMIKAIKEIKLLPILEEWGSLIRIEG
ncbi:homoserine dehydrogenase [Dictyoglomus thermophilum]|uniref:Homoserine dehydrogenase n=2 Tax=Dictyoglomus thermophilum TaxID=14 RepID=B5YEX2_DICT6|nr:homoserine dehydrogenase [Dictyoglomus thermophilum]ACI19270.1 homoserine dehydrogenase [Dictyoglomus thermophilum H-6-12]TYT21100.1 homoserine dehydrogenase [Dictyoglomus thermophilum]